MKYHMAQFKETGTGNIIYAKMVTLGGYMTDCVDDQDASVLYMGHWICETIKQCEHCDCFFEKLEGSNRFCTMDCRIEAEDNKRVMRADFAQYHMEYDQGE